MAAKAHTSLTVKAKIKEVFKTIVLYGQLAFMLAMVLIPIIFIVSSAFSNVSNLRQAGLLPDNPSLTPFIRLFEETNFVNWYRNTLFIAVMTTVLTVIFTSTVGYVFGRIKFKGQKFGLITIMVLQMFPSFMGMIALYVLFLEFGLLDNHWALILLYSAGAIPGNTWLIKGYLNSVPKELDESAMLDGANKLQIFTKIVFPLMRPIVAFIAFGAFMGPWMDFMLPRLLLRTNSNLTIGVGLFDLISGDAEQFTMFAAGAVLVAIPMVIGFYLFQKHIIQGITAGASKG
jgi:arabinogalactan oligomer/maltooligosaccharide transport system permease protein